MAGFDIGAPWEKWSVVPRLQNAHRIVAVTILDDLSATGLDPVLRIPMMRITRTVCGVELIPPVKLRKPGDEVQHCEGCLSSIVGDQDTLRRLPSAVPLHLVWG